VPWYVGTGRRIRAVTRADIESAMPHLGELIALLPRLKIVVLVGRHAQRARALLPDALARYELFECPHPSPRSLNARPALRLEILRCLEAVAERLGRKS
jgi:uracil-DNA glycosylase